MVPVPMNVTAVAAVSVIGALMVRPEGLVIKLYRMIVPVALLVMPLVVPLMV